MNKPFKTIFLAAAALALCAPASAGDAEYYGIKSRSVSLVEATAAGDAAPEVPEQLSNSTQKMAADIINTGLAAWKVIVDGKPSGTASSAYASALPPGVYMNWSGVSGWKGPKEYLYTYTVTNLMNIDVIKVKYKISFYYGGTESSGAVKGKYITNFTVKAMEVKVLWGWGFDMDVKMSHPMNIGSTKNPVAAMQSDINWSVSTPFSSDGGTWSYSVDGSGRFTDHDAKSAELTKSLTAPEASTGTVAW
jgi:hypothetical protein